MGASVSCAMRENNKLALRGWDPQNKCQISDMRYAWPKLMAMPKHVFSRTNQRFSRNNTTEGPLLAEEKTQLDVNQWSTCFHPEAFAKKKIWKDQNRQQCSQSKDGGMGGRRYISVYSLASRQSAWPLYPSDGTLHRT